MGEDSPDLYDDPDGAGGYEYDDPDELHRVRRLRQIHDARRRFDAVEAKSLDAGVRVDRPTAVAAVACGFLRQLEPIIRRSDSDLLRREVTINQQAHRVETNDGPYRAWTPARTVAVSELLDTSGNLRGAVQANGETHPVTITIRPDTSARLVRLGDDFLEDIAPSGIAEASNDEWHL